MKFKLVEEFQGKRRGGMIKYRFVTHYLQTLIDEQSKIVSFSG